ncbi:MAG: methionyl-tRNA formyltransferase [Polyangiales bacterium]
MGTPALAVPTLDALTTVSEVVGVVCQPDRPAGRGNSLRAPPVKERATSLGLDLLQPTKMKDGVVEAWIRARNADVAVVIAFGRLLPKGVLSAPRKGCLNLHASILPRYRGAAPINAAIAHGERETGISLMQMDEGLDTGPVFLHRAIAIGDDENAADLSVRIGLLGAEVVRTYLREVVQGTLVPKTQDHAMATLAPILTKEDGVIDWGRSAREIHNHVRAMQPWRDQRVTPWLKSMH